MTQVALLFRTYKTVSVPECMFFLCKTSSRGPKILFSHSARSATPLPPAFFLGPSWASFSIVKVHGAPGNSRCGVSVETSSPKWGQRPATVPKRCHKSLKATFSDPGASLWAAVAKKSALCENPIIYNVLTSFCVSWRVPVHPRNGLGNAMCTRSLLFETPLPTSGVK